MIKPRLDVLPDAQRALWPTLRQIGASFVLYGGTGLALRLGHRTSVDFDFFSSEPLNVAGLLELPFLGRSDVLQRAPDTLTVSVSAPAGDPVKLSFFGGIDTGRVSSPEKTDDGVIWIASMLDLLASKLQVLLQRVSARDYVDIAAILETGIPLADGLGAAAALYGREFPPMDAVKALGYFEEGDAVNVDGDVREVLLRHATAWDHTVSLIAKVSSALGDG